MREIKFRAWDNKHKRWLLGYEYKDLGGFSLFGEMMMFGEWVKVLGRMMSGHFGERGEKLKVMQYTGLKDKNGKEIYEGDVIEAEVSYLKTVPNMRKGIIRFERLAWRCDFGRYNYDDDEYLLSEFYSDYMEVIGNIYEHPNLLKNE